MLKDTVLHGNLTGPSSWRSSGHTHNAQKATCKGVMERNKCIDVENFVKSFHGFHLEAYNSSSTHSLTNSSLVITAIDFMSHLLSDHNLCCTAEYYSSFLEKVTVMKEPTATRITEVLRATSYCYEHFLRWIMDLTLCQKFSKCLIRYGHRTLSNDCTLVAGKRGYRMSK
jgi:hypothetical protein